jgi:hypothetical protein
MQPYSQVWSFSPPNDALDDLTSSESCPTTPEHMSSALDTGSPAAGMAVVPTSAPMSMAESSVDDGDQVMQDVFTDYSRTD